MDVIIVRHPFSGCGLLCRRENFSAGTASVSFSSSDQKISGSSARFKTRFTVFFDTYQPVWVQENPGKP